MFDNKCLLDEYVDLILELDEVTKSCEYNDRLYGKLLADIMLYQSQISREYIRINKNAVDKKFALCYK